MQLSPQLVAAVTGMGFVSPTPIQQQAIPVLTAAAQDFIGLAQTGTGKTAAFGLPLLSLINPDLPHLQALILAPTRELGKQIAAQMKAFAKFLKNINIQVVYGGTSIQNQIKELKKNPQILVATPGRLIDLTERKKVSLDRINVVVLDEADEMLSMGFQEELNKILDQTPASKKTWLFSATMPKEIKTITKKYMSNPVEVRVSSGFEVNTDIEHKYLALSNKEKIEAIMRIMDVNPDMRGIVFCRTKRETRQVAETLMAGGYKADALHGDLSQSQRDAVMKRFKNHLVNMLVGTDVAARGIDINNLTHIIHHSLPDDPTSYTHRSGRTGRAGNKGLSIAFIPQRGKRKIKNLEKSLKIKFSPISIPGRDEIVRLRVQAWAQAIAQNNTPKPAREILDDVLLILEALSKEELIEKLLAGELKKLNLNSFPAPPTHSKKREKSGRKKTSPAGNARRLRKPHTTKPGTLRGDGRRFFINIGKMDRLNQTKLIGLVAKHTGIDKNNIRNIRLLKKHAYFDVPPEAAARVSHAFKGFSYNGRSIRVNRDAD